VEWRTYEVSRQNKLKRIAVISVPLPTHTSCVRFSPNQELLLLCCIDGTIMLYDQTKSTSTSVKAAFVSMIVILKNIFEEVLFIFYIFDHIFCF
jgi:WD40 repeat protein